MAKCKILPSLDDIGIAYEHALENISDELIETVEGRRELISSALNYLKDDLAVVPSQQSLQMIIKELINYDTESNDGLMEFEAYREEVETIVTENWLGAIGKFMFYMNLSDNTELRLIQRINSEMLPLIRNLKIVGKLCAEDFKTIKEMNNLEYLDIKDTYIFNKDAESSKQFNTIPKDALSHTNISTIILPDKTKCIERAAFEKCEKLVTVRIPNKVKTIESFAFQATGLTSIIIPDSVESIGSHVFARCLNLVNAVIGDGLKATGMFTFSKCINLQAVQLGRELELIECGAFEYCIRLPFITFPNKLQSILDSAFLSCESLSSFKFSFPDSLESIGNYSFSECSNLKTVYIGDNIQYLGRRAFGTCKGLETLVLSENVAWIECNAFAECKELKYIYCKRKTPPSILRKNWYGSKRKNLNLYVPKGCSKIYKEAPGWEYFINIIEEEIFL